MIKPFYLTVSLLLLTISSLTLHYNFNQSQDITDNINAVAGLTRVSALSLGVAYYEQRVEINGGVNTIYPEMMPLDQMDFVYAK